MSTDADAAESGTLDQLRARLAEARGAAEAAPGDADAAEDRFNAQWELANAAIETGDRAEARSLIAGALSDLEASEAPWRDRVALLVDRTDARIGLGRAFVEEGLWDDAFAVLQEALEEGRAFIGIEHDDDETDHPAVVWLAAVHNLTSSVLASGQPHPEGLDIEALVREAVDTVSPAITGGSEFGAMLAAQLRTTLGRLLDASERPDEAVACYAEAASEAATSAADLGQDNSHMLRLSEAQARLYHAKGLARGGASQEAVAECDVAVTAIAAVDPGVQPELVQPLLAAIHCQGAVSRAAHGDIEGAVKSARTALTVCQELARALPGVGWDRVLLASLEQNAELLLRAGDKEGAIQYFTWLGEAEVQTARAVLTGDALEKRLCDVQSSVGQSLLRAGDAEAAAEHLGEASKTCARLRDADPENSELALAAIVAETRLASALHSGRKMEEASERFGRCAQAVTNLVQAHPDEVRFKVAQSEIAAAIADFLRTAGAGPDSLRNYLAAAHIAAAVAEECPEDPAALMRLRDLRTRAAQALLEARQLDLSIQLRQGAVEATRKLAVLDSGNWQWEREIEIQLGALSETLEGAGRRDEALATLAEAHELATKLAARDPEHPTLKDDLAYCTSRTAVLHATQDAEGSARVEAAIAAVEAARETSREPVRMLGELVVLHRTQARIEKGASQFEDALATYAKAVEALGRLEKVVTVDKQAQEGLMAEIESLELLAGVRPAETLQQQIALAREHYGQGDFERAAELLSTAFEHDDLDWEMYETFLFTATSAAVRAAETIEAETPDDERVQRWRDQGFEWLEAILRLRRKRLERIDSRLVELANEPQAEAVQERAKLSAMRNGVIEFFNLAREEDADLSSIRGDERFQALFEGLPRGDEPPEVPAQSE